MKCLSLLMVFSFIGCTENHFHDQGGQIVCSLNKEAYFVKNGIGDTVFLHRAPQIDAMCNLKE